MKKMLRKKWNTLRMLIYVLLRAARTHQTAEETNKILVFISGHIGDVLMDAKAIESLIDAYTGKGKQIYLMGTKLVNSVLRMTTCLDGVTFLEVEEQDIVNNNIRKVVQILKNLEFEQLITITPWDTYFNLSLASCLCSHESWEVIYKRKNHGVNMWRAILRCLHRDYTNRIYVDMDVQQAQRTAILLHALGVERFGTEVAYIPKQSDFSVPGPYITIAVDSMDTQRRWPTKRFIELIRWFLKEWDVDIYLTGSRVSEQESNLYTQTFQNNERVKITINGLKLGEWIELIRGSQLHIGVDSGSIHVASSVGTKNLCLTGAWDGRRWVPYHMDKGSLGTTAPACIYRTDVDWHSLPCYGCFGKKNYGYGNRACREACEHQLPNLCLQNLNIEDVIFAIRNIF